MRQSPNLILRGLPPEFGRNRAYVNWHGTLNGNPIACATGRWRSYRDGLAADTQLTARFNAGLLERGILKGWPQKFYPSLAHTDEGIDRTIEAFS